MANDSDYVDSEYLAQIAAVLENEKRATYERLHVTTGNRVLDVGCGPGTDTIPLAKLVGATGTVVGVDKDAEMVALANFRAAEQGVAGWTKHYMLDASKLPFDDGFFDAVRAERFFQHVQDPLPAFREMVRVTRPGGYILVLDVDYASTSIALDEHELERRFARVILEHSAKNGYAAREMPLLFQQANLDEIDLMLSPVLYTDYDAARQLGRWDEIERAGLDLNLLNHSELEHLHASAERAAQNGSFFAQVNLVLVWGRKGEGK